MDQAGDDYIKGAIIENTFTSICDMADAVFSFLKFIPTLKKKMLRLRWESIDQVEYIKTPIFFISGDMDTLVPTEMTYRLDEKTKNSESKEVWIIPGGQHNNTFAIAGPMYFTRLRQFLDKCKSITLRKGLGHQEPQEKPKKKKTPSPVRKAKVEIEEEITDGLGAEKVKSKSDDVLD